MTEKFSALRARMSPESQARAEAIAQAMLAEMPLTVNSQLGSGFAITDDALLHPGDVSLNPTKAN